MASGKRQPKKGAWLTLSPCAQPGFNPVPTGLLNQAWIAPIHNRKAVDLTFGLDQRGGHF
jgi:hypothetical protein